MNKTQQFVVYATAASLALIFGALLAWSQRGGAAARTTATIFQTARAFPGVALTDHTGQPFDREHLRGRWSWLFFGFTHCPDVCPATLQVLRQARDLLPSGAPSPQVILVSVDPERDTPEALARYVAHFDPEFVGATGTEESIRALTEALYISYARVPLENGNYTVDHSAAIYFLNPDAEIVAVTTPPHGATAMASDFVAVTHR